MGAGLRQNLGRKWGPQTWKQMAGSMPNKVFSDAAERSAKTVSNDRKRKGTNEAKEQRRKSKYTKIDNSIAARKAYTRHDEGVSPDEITEDISSQRVENKRQKWSSLAKKHKQLRRKQDNRQRMMSGNMREGKELQY